MSPTLTDPNGAEASTKKPEETKLFVPLISFSKSSNVTTESSETENGAKRQRNGFVIFTSSTVTDSVNPNP
jgi:hypothetical protein